MTGAQAADPAAMQRERLRELLTQRAHTASTGHPLSEGQRALWLLHQLNPNDPAYNEVMMAELVADRSDDEVLSAYRILLARHACLRTTYGENAGVPTQVVRPVDDSLTFTVHHLGAASDAECTRIAQRLARAPFALGAGPVARVDLLRRVGAPAIFLFTAHHIALDGWSFMILTEDLCALLSGAEPRALSPVGYLDHCVAQARSLSGPRGVQLRDYWRGRLADLPEPLDLGATGSRGPLAAAPAAVREFRVDAALNERVRDFAVAAGVTVSTVFMTTFQALLRWYALRDDIVIGTFAGGRPASVFETVVGYFVNPVVLRADLSDDPTFTELVRRGHATLIDALDHQDYPFQRIVADLAVPRDVSRNPIFDVLFSFQSQRRFSGRTLDELASKLTLGDGAGEPADAPLRFLMFEQEFAKFDLILEVFEVGTDLTVYLKYRADLFEPELIDRLGNSFRTLARRALDDPGARISQLSPLSPAEFEEVVGEYNGTAEEFDADPIPLHAIDEQIRRTPEIIACVSGEESLTYAELGYWTDQYAGELVRAGVRPGEFVGVALERSCELIVAILAVLRAGAVYVPLDPELPADRIDYVLRDTGARFAIGDGTRETRPVRWLTVSRPMDTADTPVVFTPPAPDAVAYAMYTSGSTGYPKGVLITHRALANRLNDGARRFGLSPADAMLQRTALSFDVSVGELLLPLVSGARLVFAKPGGHRDPGYLADLIAREAITTAYFVPSTLRLFLTVADADSCASLRRVFCIGEELTAELRDRFFERLDCELYNFYGPTEATIEATAWRCENDDDRRYVPIGTPLANTTIYLLDDRHQAVPVGGVGEICLGGVQVALGYLNKPGRTAESFVADPFTHRPGARMYRTGDLARRHIDGTVRYLGRRDGQAKVRGARIETAEVEFQLSAHAAVDAAVVSVVDTDAGNDLVAHLVVAEPAPSVAELREHLSAVLPQAMIPHRFHYVDAIPLTPSGKADRRGLLRDAANRGVSRTAPRGPTSDLEIAVAKVWQEVLGANEIGIDDNFFDLGGDSVRLVAVHRELTRIAAREFPMIELFRYPTISSTAAYLENPAVEDRAETGRRRGQERQEFLRTARRSGGRSAR
ncbi:non-ribosomal peptide synthetase [Nocardia niigatensis]